MKYIIIIIVIFVIDFLYKSDILYTFRYKISWIHTLLFFIVIYINSLLYIFRFVPLLAYILMLDLSVWCVSKFCKYVVQKRENSIMRLLEECRIAEFIEKYSKEHSRETKKGFHPDSAIIAATAYMYLGELETSIEMFKSIEIKMPKKLGKRLLANAIEQSALYHNNFSCAYLRCHETEQAKIHMEKARDFLEQLKEIETKIKGKQKNPAIEILSRALAMRDLEMELELDIKQDYGEEIKRLKNMLDSAAIRLQRVYYNYLLYVLYRKNGDLKESDKFGEYVKKNGGDTCYVKWVE